MALDPGEQFRAQPARGGSRREAAEAANAPPLMPVAPSSATPSGRSSGITSVANSSALRVTCSCVDGPIANSPISCPNPPSSA